MSPSIPVTFVGRMWYLLSALLVSVALVVNVKVHRTLQPVARIAQTDQDLWNEEDYCTCDALSWTRTTGACSPHGCLIFTAWLEADYPPSLIPLSQHPRNAALVIEDTVHYAPNASADWHSIFPAGSGGFVKLGPHDRLFGVSMFHQLHCLDKMRRAVVAMPSSEWESWHTQHCLNYVRQMLLCAASVRLEPVKVAPGKGQEGLKVDGFGLQHECRDWSALREAVEANHERWESDV